MTNQINPTGSAPAAVYPSDLGDLNVLSDELIANIFSQVEQVVFDSPTRFVCRDFEQIANDPFTAYLHLENALKEKTALTFDEITSYRILFKQRYRQELSLSKFFAKCPQLTTLDFSNSAIDNASLAAILKAAGPLCPLQTLNLTHCTGLTSLFYLNELKSLQNLDLRGCTGLAGLLNLQGLNQLTILNLGRCTGLTGQLNLQGLNRLTTLNLVNCTGLTGLLNLQGLNQLIILDLGGCAGLTGLLNLQGLNQLKSLNLLFCTGLTDLLNLQGLNQLTSLNLFGCTGLANIDLSTLSAGVQIIQ